MARGFSSEGADTVYTPYLYHSRGFIKIKGVSFNESTGKITITWDLGFIHDYSSGGSLISAAAAAFGGKLYDSDITSDVRSYYQRTIKKTNDGFLTTEKLWV